MANTYFNQIHRTIYLNSGKSVKLSNKDELAHWLVRTKQDFANIAFYINSIAYPVFSLLPHGPKYTFDALDGLAATTLVTYPEEHGGNVYGPDCYWVKDGLDGGRPATVKETLDCILAMVTNQEVIVQTQDQDLSEIESKIQCLTQNDLKIVNDAFGCNYLLNCTNAGEFQFSLARHIHEILKLTDATQAHKDSLKGYICATDPAYPALTIKVSLSKVVRDICFMPEWVCSFTGAAYPGANLQKDLECITEFIGGGTVNDCKPTYSTRIPHTLQMVSDGQDLELAIATLDENIKAWQKINLSASGGTVVGASAVLADNFKDTLEFIAGSGIELTGNSNPKTIKISATGGGIGGSLQDAYDFTLTPVNLDVGLINLDSALEGAQHSNWSSSLNYPNLGAGLTLFDDKTTALVSKLFHIDNGYLTQAYFSVGQHDPGHVTDSSRWPKPVVSLESCALYLQPQGEYDPPSTTGVQLAGTTALSTPHAHGTVSDRQEYAIWVQQMDAPSFEDKCNIGGLKAGDIYFRQPGDGDIYKLNDCGGGSSSLWSQSGANIWPNVLNTGGSVYIGDSPNSSDESFATLEVKNIAGGKLLTATTTANQTITIDAPGAVFPYELSKGDYVQLGTMTPVRVVDIITNTQITVASLTGAGGTQTIKVFASPFRVFAGQRNVTIDPVGNLGIGLESPEATIDVMGSTSVSAAVFAGTGINDLTSGGTLSGTHTDMDFLVEIDTTGTPDTFQWSNDGGASWITGVSITASVAQNISHGVTITFAADTGHTHMDQWKIRGSVNNPQHWSNSSGDQLMLVGDDGNVGIGNSDPLAKLHVEVGSLGAYPTISSDTVGIFQRNFFSGNNAAVSIIAEAGGTSLLNFGDQHTENKGLIGYSHSADSMLFTTNSTAQVSIDSNGNTCLKDQNELQFEDNINANTVGFKAPATVSSSHTYTWPTSFGSAGQVLTDVLGNGTLSWGAGGGGGGSAPGGPQYAVQFNNPIGTFAGDAIMTFDTALGQLSILGTAQTKGHISCRNSLTTQSEQFGAGAFAGGDVYADGNNTAVGWGSLAGSHTANSVTAAIGECTALGFDSQAEWAYGTSIGAQSRAGSTITIGGGEITAEVCTAIGFGAQANTQGSIAIGAMSKAQTQNGVNAGNIAAIGGSQVPVKYIQIGSGDFLAGIGQDATHNTVHIKATDSDPAVNQNDDGQSITITPGLGVGDGSGGEFGVDTSPPGATNSAAYNPAIKRFRVLANGQVEITSGSLTMVEIATPATATGLGQLYTDSTTHNLNFIDGSGVKTDLTAGPATDQIALTAQFFGG